MRVKKQRWVQFKPAEKVNRCGEPVCLCPTCKGSGCVHCEKTGMMKTVDAERLLRERSLFHHQKEILDRKWGW